MKFKERTIDALADMICGNTEVGKEKLFPYRSSSVITRFFRDCDTDYFHDGSTRNWWVGERVKEVLLEPQLDANTPSDTFARLIRTLMDVGEATDEDPRREKALAALNAALAREGFEAFYAADKQCYLRHIATNKIAMPSPNPHRPFSAAEMEKREELLRYLGRASEDALIEEILLPLFDNSAFIGSLRAAIRIRRLSMARTSG